MKDSDSSGRSSKKANGRTGAKISSGSSNKSIGSTDSNKRTKTTRTIMGATNSRPTKTANSPKTTKAKGPRKSNKQSPELRPKRRASRTYFFKYQLARNPLKAEEEDLKLALLASLEQCNSNGASDADTKDCTDMSTADEESKPKNKNKPETEDFLTFICFRTTAPLKQCTSTLYKLTSNNGSPISNDHYSPNNHRRPTRQSPRLARSNRKISENDSSNHTRGTLTTAYDNSITYEEDMKRASIALEDMAQEINSSDGVHNEVAQNSPDCISKSSPYKNNKHLVKGLMTREFAGAFADEETIFESISNHKL